MILKGPVKALRARYNDHYNTTAGDGTYHHNVHNDHHSCDRDRHNQTDHNRVHHLELHEQLHLRDGDVNDDEFGQCY
ncbi:hypothetical protein AAVH_24074 [Aphelenchoides avenae]|nr:hypothetical protein AAVH_24074 [Aphelenchus avenae]